jgi:putative oxidoreductase
MVVAVFWQHGDNGLWNMLPGMGFLWLAIVYMIVGSGRFGLDYIISKKIK